MISCLIQTQPPPKNSMDLQANLHTYYLKKKKKSSNKVQNLT